MKKILISGANFRNKGAQSMLFVAVEELQRKFPDCEVYFGCLWEDSKVENAKFKQIAYAKEIRRILAGKEVVYNLLLCVVKSILSMMRGNFTTIGNFLEAKKTISKIDMILDVSGFAIGDKWSKKIHEGVLDSIRIGKKYGIEVYLMPQSFGPFNYSKENEHLKQELKELLPCATKIFAREKQGYEFLIKEFDLKNVVLSKDMVLQTSEIHVDKIYLRDQGFNLPKIVTSNNVGIIPNDKIFTHGDAEHVMNAYRAIVDELLEYGKDIYLFRHSREDLPAVQRIGSMYENNGHVHVVENDFSCLEFDKFIKNFEFVVCSRFHGVVHSYRNHVPVLVLGWAIKYLEVAQALGQECYVFNVTDENSDIDEIRFAIRKLIVDYEKEKNTIALYLNEIQKESCFDLM